MNRKLFTLLTLILLPSLAMSQVKPTEFFDKVDSFMHKHVHDGLVAYSTIKQSPKALETLAASIAVFDLAQLPDESGKKAFWINAYNVLVIKSVVANYPIKSPMDVAGFFDKQKHKIAGEKLTLNEIENIKLRKKYGDARIHFALVCAALSCPPLVAQAYFPDGLDKQLDERTRSNLNDAEFIRLDGMAKKVSVSEIFKWYAGDFDKNLLDYLNRYRQQTIPDNYAVDNYTYDWRLNEYIEIKTGQLLFDSSNLQAYTPSTLLSPGEMEVKTFNNLYTQTAFYDSDGKKMDLHLRSTFFTNISSFLFGFKENVNLGIDIYFKSVRNDESSASPLSVFKFSSGNSSRTALTAIAPRVKLSPFTRFRNFSLQTLVLIPLQTDIDSMPFLDYGDLQWWTQFFYDKNLTDKFLLYLEHGWAIRFGENLSFDSPVKAIFNYYPSYRWTVYLPTELTPTWDGLSWSAYYFQAGLGLKYQLTPNFELESLLTKFLKGKQAGAGVTYNMGVRIII